MTSIEQLVDRQLKKLAVQRNVGIGRATPSIDPRPSIRVVTISRQCGSGGRMLATRLADALRFECVDRQILDFIVKNTNARERLIDSLDEKTRSGVDLWVEGLLRGRYVDQSEYVHWLVKSVTAMAEHGKAVILGRGGNVIIGDRGGLHIRVVAPRDVRVTRLANQCGVSTDDARRRIETSDEQRRGFYWANFGADIDNPLDYDVVINTGNTSLDAALDLVLTLWRARFGPKN